MVQTVASVGQGGDSDSDPLWWHDLGVLVGDNHRPSLEGHRVVLAGAVSTGPGSREAMRMNHHTAGCRRDLRAVPPGGPRPVQ